MNNDEQPEPNESYDENNERQNTIEISSEQPPESSAERHEQPPESSAERHEQPTESSAERQSTSGTGSPEKEADGPNDITEQLPIPIASGQSTDEKANNSKQLESVHKSTSASPERPNLDDNVGSAGVIVPSTVEGRPSSSRRGHLGVIFEPAPPPGLSAKSGSFKSNTVIENPSSLSGGLSELKPSSQTLRQCWICYVSDEDETTLTWIQPCNCRGSTKWVHQSCLQTWVDEKLKEYKNRKVACPQCKTEYLLFVPKSNVLVFLLDRIDNAIYRVCPFIAAGVLVGTLYWNSVTYGALVVFQIAGGEVFSDGVKELGMSVALAALPLIPLTLIVYRLFQWEDIFLECLRMASYCIPLVHYVLPSYVLNESGLIQMSPPSITGVTLTRILAGALVLPTIAQICGNFFFETIPSPIERTFAGGAAFILVKGLIKMFHKQRTYRMICGRKILDYTEENRSLIASSRRGGPPTVSTPGRQ